MFLLLVSLAFLEGFGITDDIKITAIADSTQYFLGGVYLYSIKDPWTAPGDPKLTLGEPYPSLAKREMWFQQNKMRETIIQPSEPNSGVNFKTVITHFDFVSETPEGALEFTVKDYSNTFDGKMLFFGTPWNWDRWTYQIEMTDAMESQFHFKFFEGESKIIKCSNSNSSPEGGFQLNTKKYFLNRQKGFLFSLFEKFRSISQVHYDQIVQCLKKMGTPHLDGNCENQLSSIIVEISNPMNPGWECER